ncbi:hypothetical protein BDV97DRAFT_132206 [Delphinella strobiligena]|nr:hypothetical protein BDV97DRAFT_132206 [Delphinella strobiligena]
MCLTQCYKSKECGHFWSVIILTLHIMSYTHSQRRMMLHGRCHRGRNLSNCPKLEPGQPEGPLHWPDWYFVRVAPRGSCPMCDLEGDYDRKAIRMVEIVSTGARLTAGAGRNRAGVDFHDRAGMCCTLM